MPKPDAVLCMRADLLLDKKKPVENQDWALGPPGRQRLPGCWAVAGRRPWAAGPRAVLLANPKINLPIADT